LFKDRVKGPLLQIALMVREGYPAFFGWVFKLDMRAVLLTPKPVVITQKFQNFPNRPITPCRASIIQPRRGNALTWQGGGWGLLGCPGPTSLITPHDTLYPQYPAPYSRPQPALGFPVPPHRGPGCPVPA
jgi:hypothetical protein